MSVLWTDMESAGCIWWGMLGTNRTRRTGRGLLPLRWQMDSQSGQGLEWSRFKEPYSSLLRQCKWPIRLHHDKDVESYPLDILEL